MSRLSSDLCDCGCGEWSGWTIVSFDPRARGWHDDMAAEEVAEILGIDASVHIQPLILSVTRADLRALEAPAWDPAQELSRPLIHLAETWRIFTRCDRALEEQILTRATDLEIVRAAWRELRVSLPAEPLAHQQPYLNDRFGMEVENGWNIQGARGVGARLIDVEWGWDLSHQELSHLKVRSLCGENMADRPHPDPEVTTAARRHGTRALAAAIAPQNGQGIVGVAPEVAEVGLASAWRPDDPHPHDGHVADAIAAAIAFHTSPVGRSLRNVLLIEMQRGDANPLPVEVDPADLSALILAYNHRLPVIEAAGNGGNDLDGYDSRMMVREGGRLLPFRFHLNRSATSFIDSGATLVGGAARIGAGHALAHFSNHGSRIDVVAPALRVVSAGSDGPAPRRGFGQLGADPPDAYTRSFGGTSAASALVAGLALGGAGAARRAGAGDGRPWPHELRQTLAQAAQPRLHAAPTSRAVPSLRRVATAMRKLPSGLAPGGLPLLACELSAPVAGASFNGPQMGWCIGSMVPIGGGTAIGEVYGASTSGAAYGSVAVTGSWTEDWAWYNPSNDTYKQSFHWSAIQNPAAPTPPPVWTSQVWTSILQVWPNAVHRHADITYVNFPTNTEIDQRYPINTGGSQEWAGFEVKNKQNVQVGRLLRFQATSGSPRAWHEIWVFFDNFQLLLYPEELQVLVLSTSSQAENRNNKANDWLKNQTAPTGRTLAKFAAFNL